jgi:hypothetical protein
MYARDGRPLGLSHSRRQNAVETFDAYVRNKCEAAIINIF